MGSLPAELRARTSHLFKEKLAVIVRKQLLNQEQKFRLASKRAEYGELLCQHEGCNPAAVVAALLLSTTENPLPLLQELAAAETLTKEVQRLLPPALPSASNAQQEALSNEQIQSTTIFHDACLLADMSLHLLSEATELCLTATGKLEAEKIHDTPAP
jgi:hypothetical protein